MSRIKCTKCGQIIDRTQATTQMVMKMARDIYKLNSARAAAGGFLDSFLAGCATESGIKCPKCDSVKGFVPARDVTP